MTCDWSKTIGISRIHVCNFHIIINYALLFNNNKKVHLKKFCVLHFRIMGESSKVKNNHELLKFKVCLVNNIKFKQPKNKAK